MENEEEAIVRFEKEFPTVAKYVLKECKNEPTIPRNEAAFCTSHERTKH